MSAGRDAHMLLILLKLLAIFFDNNYRKLEIITLSDS